MREFQKHLSCTIMIDISFTPFPFLATENYALRNLLPEDEQEIFALRSSDEINKYLDRPKAHTLDDARNFINSIAKNNAIFWVVTPKVERNFLDQFVSGKFQERMRRQKSASSCFPKIMARESCRK